MIMESARRLMNISMYMCTTCTLIVMGFNDTSTLEREKRDRRDEREG